ncbi:hypothetical protein F0562_010179 [Nyssa sinensis]|uniref:Terpene synthase N-terminal domain-containing protein n=1 Tax=Nyssa sinensis TaxID=561372 RepID=A0A5J5A105_9ASTE|nr:hypothetical protein F0562_010179 [Nyssa sinensis]
MSVQASAVLVSTQNVVPEENDSQTELQVQQLKEEVRKMVVGAADKPAKQLKLIDAIQRLGVSYHFETEIEAALQHIYDTYHLHGDNENDDDLYTTTLCFRLLRQQGHFMSCDVFNKFKDNKGKFMESLIIDVRGMLSLYEATHLKVYGEDILDEALAFTTAHLESLASNLSNPVATQVMHALERPI